MPRPTITPHQRKPLQRKVLQRRPPTISDIARELGVHKSTVSTALSGKGRLSDSTREKVLTTARELGYAPSPLAQRLARGGSNNTVCVFNGVLDVGLATQKILMIQHSLSTRGLEVPVYTFSGRERDDGETQAMQIRQLCRQRPCAIVCAAQRLYPSAFPELENYQREGGIVVSYDTPVPLDCDQVVFDREDNTYQAAKHLLEQGHRHISIGVSSPARWSPDEKNEPLALRLPGFRRALKEFNGAHGDQWLFQSQPYEQGGITLARHYLQLRNRPTGVCIVNDYVALGFMVELMKAGVRVPEEVSIIGHDNQPVAAYCPVPLTSVSQPVDEIVHAVLEMLMERINGSRVPPRTVTLKGQLVRRQSVAAPAA